MNQDTHKTAKPIKVIHRLVNKITRQFEKKHPNRRLNQYGTLQKRIAGTGASATVNIIQNRNSLYAVKVFPKNKQKTHETPLMKKRLLSEYCISSVLNHPNIIKTIDLVLDTKYRYCIIMEYCPEGDLYSWIKEGRLTGLHTINDLFKQLLQGLLYLHSLGVAHRDIKPENLLIQSIGGHYQLKITDFGEADVFRESLQTESRLSDGMCGSLPYMAPEIFQNSSYDASQADVWSAAIVYTCMRLKGVPFFSARSSDANYQHYQTQYVKRKYPAFDVLDKESQDLLYDMLNPAPEKRFTVQDVLKLTCMANV
ncbi:unnamed protein product [Rhizopus stolonifer]